MWRAHRRHGSPFSAPGDRGDQVRLQIKAANALVVQIAEVDRAVWAKDDAVGVVHLRIGVAWDAGAENGGDGRGCCARRWTDTRQRHHRTDETRVVQRHVSLAMSAVALVGPVYGVESYP